MFVCQLCHHTTTRGALDEALHDKEWLVDLLDGTSVLADGSSNSGDSNGTATEFVDDGEQDAVVDFIETVLVDIQRCVRYP